MPISSVDKESSLSSSASSKAIASGAGAAAGAGEDIGVGFRVHRSRGRCGGVEARDCEFSSKTTR
jgi:hypothetical protein